MQKYKIHILLCMLVMVAIVACSKKDTNNVDSLLIQTLDFKSSVATLNGYFTMKLPADYNYTSLNNNANGDFEGVIKKEKPGQDSIHIYVGYGYDYVSNSRFDYFFSHTDNEIRTYISDPGAIIEHTTINNDQALMLTYHSEGALEIDVFIDNSNTHKRIYMAAYVKSLSLKDLNPADIAILKSVFKSIQRK